MSARSAHIDRLFAMFRSHYDHGTTAQFFAHSCMTSRLTRADVTQRLGPGGAIDNTLLTNRPPMNARLYFVWPGVPLVAFHYDKNDTLVFINDGIRYWGTPPRDYLEYYGCTNTWSLPAEGEAAKLRDTIGPAIRKLLRDQGHNI